MSSGHDDFLDSMTFDASRLMASREEERIRRELASVPPIPSSLSAAASPNGHVMVSSATVMGSEGTFATEYEANFNSQGVTSANNNVYGSFASGGQNFNPVNNVYGSFASGGQNFNQGALGIGQRFTPEYLLERVTRKAKEHIKIECREFREIVVVHNSKHYEYDIACLCGFCFLRGDELSCLNADNRGPFLNSCRSLSHILSMYAEEERLRVSIIIEQASEDIQDIVCFSNVEFEISDQQNIGEFIDPIACMEIL